LIPKVAIFKHENNLYTIAPVAQFGPTKHIRWEYIEHFSPNKETHKMSFSSKGNE